MGFFELLIQIYPKLLAGLGVTIQLTVISLLLAIVMGMISCFFRISKLKVLNFISNVYVDIIRGTPLLVQAFFVYFGITQALSFRMSAFTAAIIVLSLNAGAYLSEIFRSGISAISIGQMEAARSLGLPYSKAMTKVILPQAFRIVIPSIVNQFIITIKDTSILSVIGLPELTFNGKIIVARNFESFKVYAMVGIMYFIVIMILTKVSKVIERRMSYGKSAGN